MCMHWLKNVRLNTKDRLKNMGGTTVEAALLADISGAYSAISSLKAKKTHGFNSCFVIGVYPLDILSIKKATKYRKN